MRPTKIKIEEESVLKWIKSMLDLTYRLLNSNLSPSCVYVIPSYVYMIPKLNVGDPKLCVGDSKLCICDPKLSVGDPKLSVCDLKLCVPHDPKLCFVIPS